MLAPSAFLLAAVAVTLMAAIWDLRTGHIPNGLTLGTIVVALVVGVTDGLIDGRSLLESIGRPLLGVAAVAVVPLALWFAGAMGGGDVKLLAAVGALCGPVLGIESEFYSFVAGAIFAPALLTYRGELARTLLNTLRLATNLFLPKRRRVALDPRNMAELRFGPAVFAGTLVMACLNVNWSTL